MKRILGFAGLMLTLGAGSAYALNSYSVYVQNPDGTPIASAYVMAVVFGSKTPDPVNTQITTTGPTGLANFTLPDGMSYDVFASSQNFSPSALNQFNNPTHIHIFSGPPAPAQSTVTLTNQGANAFAEVDADFKNSNVNLGRLVFGSIQAGSGGNNTTIAYGFGVVTDVGAPNPGKGRILVFNVPFSQNGVSYSFYPVDPSLGGGGKCVTVPIATTLSASNTYYLFTGANTVDFNTAIPPITVVNQASQNGTTGSVSVDGVVTDTNSVNSVPYMGISFEGIASTTAVIRDFNTGSTATVTNIIQDCKWANADTNGRFQLYGLYPGTTYYAQAFGGCDFSGNCYQGYSSPAEAGVLPSNGGGGNCQPLNCGGLNGFNNPCPAPASNDFLFTGSALTANVKLNTAPRSTGAIAVYVKDSNGNPMPQSWVSVWPDGQPWSVGAGGNCLTRPFVSNPGLANINAPATTGYFLVTGLPSGNYSIQAGTPFSQGGNNPSVNAGPDGTMCWQEGSSNFGGGPSGPGNCGCGAQNDDLRITVDTTAALPNDVFVFNSSGTNINGAAIGVSSLTVTVHLSSSGLAGTVSGTLTFPGTVNLSNDPVNITYQPQCTSGQCPGGGNFVFFNSASTGPVISYSVNIATGQAYWKNITAKYWGVIRQGEGQDQLDLTNSNSAVQNIVFAPAGRILGKVYKPDGSVLQPTNNNGGWINVNAEGQGVDSWGWGQLNNDGSFVMGGLLPGTYQVRIQGNGSSFTFTDKQPIPTAVVTAGLDTQQDVTLVNADAVLPKISTSSLSPISFVACPGNTFGGECPPENWNVKSFPQGGIFNLDAIVGIMSHGGNDSSTFRFALSSAASQNVCNGTSLPGAGFCFNRLAAPGIYDFYLLRRGEFDQRNLAGTRPYFVVLNSTRNIVVNDQMTNVGLFSPSGGPSGSTTSVRPVDLTPAVSQAGNPVETFNGVVSGLNIFRQQDFANLGGSFDNFIKFVPIMSLYDAGNNLRASGMAVPNPSCFGTLTNLCGTTPQFSVDACFQQAIAQSNFNLFQQIFNSCGGTLGYEIRGISTGTYTAVLTTPNYPPYQTTITLDGSVSTKTLNVNLDQAVGAGASLTGVVTDTTTAQNLIVNASVIISAPSIKDKVVATNASGVYRVDGLPAGTYKITVNASNFAPAKAITDVGSSGVFTQNFSGANGLLTAGASITGTVYAQKIPFTQTYPGAEIVAYDDTINVQSSGTVELPLFKTFTSSVGVYNLTNLVVGHVYKVYVDVKDSFILNQSTLTVNGVVSGIDFTLFNKPLDPQVSGRPVGINFEFTVFNPKNFSSGKAWIGVSPFVKANSTDVSNNFQFLPNNQLVLDFPLASLTAGTDYILHIEAVGFDGATVTKEIVFSTSRKANSISEIDAALLGDDSTDQTGKKLNEAALDSSGNNPSVFSIPTGAILPVSTAAVPTIQFTQTDVNASTVSAAVGAAPGGTAAFQSSVYQLTLSSINYTSKGVDLELGYNKSNSDLTNLAMYHFNASTNQWELIPGSQTIDPVKGTIKVKRIKSLASVLGLKNGHPLLALSDGKSYRPSAAGLIPDDVGMFALMLPSLVGGNFSGTVIKIFNFPNPFNLSQKTVTLANPGTLAASQTINGTMIKIELPAGANGQGILRIYTVAGELVRELDLGSLTGGSFIYTQWDGKNKSGVNVANGVYYGVLSIPGVKVKDATFKLAVIK